MDFSIVKRIRIPAQLRLRREERWPALAAAVVIVALNALMVARHFAVFSKNVSGGFWVMYGGQFHVSGYDPSLYHVLTVWQVAFNGFRHPLLLWMLWPAAQLNGWLMDTLGVNCTQIVAAAMLAAAGFASFILLHRLLRDVVGLGRGDTALLAGLFFSFAYVMVAVAVPDHFAFSQCLLLLTLYVAGLRLRQGRPLPGWLTALLFVATAGVTLTNGVKVFMAQWMACGRRFFGWRNLLLAVALPSALIVGACFYVGEVPKYRTEADLERQNAQLARLKMPQHHDRGGEPFAREGFLSLTDATTPRLNVVVENLFGESVQLHSDHLLGDVWIDRPVIVRYRWAANYAVGLALVLLFAWGAWCGRRSRLLWLCLAWFGFDMALSLGLGFGITEIYIFAPHWLFVVPVAMAFAFKASAGRRLSALRAAVLALALWLWAYNGTLFVGYLVGS